MTISLIQFICVAGYMFTLGYLQPDGWLGLLIV